MPLVNPQSGLNESAVTKSIQEQFPRTDSKAVGIVSKMAVVSM